MAEPIESIQIKRANNPDFCRRVENESRQRGDNSVAKTLRDLASERLAQLEWDRKARGPATPSAETPEPAAAA